MVESRKGTNQLWDGQPEYPPTKINCERKSGEYKTVESD